MQKIFLILLPLFLCSSEFVMIDDTEEGKKKAKENTIALDGKIIYRPMTPNIIEPMTPNIIYPIGSNNKLENRDFNTSKEIEKNNTRQMEDVFASINSDENQSKVENVTAGKDVEIKESTQENRALNLEIKE